MVPTEPQWHSQLSEPWRTLIAWTNQEDTVDRTSYQRTIDWLRQLPTDSAVTWGDASTSDEQPWCYGWVDVLMPPLQETACLG